MEKHESLVHCIKQLNVDLSATYERSHRLLIWSTYLQIR